MLSRFAVPVIAAVLAGTALVAAGVGGVYAQEQRVASQPVAPISMSEAVRDAMPALPDNGRHYRMTAAQLEPSSRHYVFTTPSGGSFGSDSTQECLFIPPFPPLRILTTCRYYPVWVVAFSGSGCEAIVAINAYSGRFAGGGSGGDTSCSLNPPVPPATPWFEPAWN